MAVENNGASAVTSHEKLPDRPKFTLRIITWVAFETLSYKINNKMKEVFFIQNGMIKFMKLLN